MNASSTTSPAVLDGRSLRNDLDLALDAAGQADAISAPFYSERSFTLDWKANRTEVTEADRQCELAISSTLLTARPDDGLFGEEHGLVGSTESAWRWIIDPIDGTSNFVRGIPVWATLIALTHDTHGPVVGVVSAPAIGRRWWAALGGGAWSQVGSNTPRRCSVSPTEHLADAQVSVTYAHGWDDLNVTPALVELQRAAYRARGFGDFWQHMLVAEGAVDIAIDAVGLAPYDLAAVQVIVEEAGGTFTDRHGTRTYLSDTAVSSNGLLHAEAIRRTST
jgi:histidinol-phosphatase